MRDLKHLSPKEAEDYLRRKIGLLDRALDRLHLIHQRRQEEAFTSGDDDLISKFMKWDDRRYIAHRRLIDWRATTADTLELFFGVRVPRRKK